MLKTLTKNMLITLTLLCSLNTTINNKEREIDSEHIRIFKQSLELDLNQALDNAYSYIKQIDYLDDSTNYGFSDYVASFKVINQRKKDDCDGDAVAGMVLLYKFNPKMIIMGEYRLNNSDYGHAFCFIEKDGKFYSSGISNRQGYNSLKHLIQGEDSTLVSPHRDKWKYYWICDYKLEDLLNADDNIDKRKILINQGQIN
ncbi:MAG: hypothetical protein AABX61_02890 [Nanoarchaeota archaeon]